MPRPTRPSEPLPDLLAHDDTGSGPAVLLLHSGVADRRMWSALAELPAAKGGNPPHQGR